MRIRANSRRYMGSQSSAYGNAHQDGALHVGAAASREPRVVTVVDGEQQDSKSLTAPSRSKRPPRSNSMSR